VTIQHTVLAFDRAEESLDAALLPGYLVGTVDYSSTYIGKPALSFPVLSAMDSQICNLLVRKRNTVKARARQSKKYTDNLQENVDVHNVNVRLQLGEKGGKNETFYRISYNITIVMKRNSTGYIGKYLQKHIVN
jgi:hypothetical protein